MDTVGTGHRRLLLLRHAKSSWDDPELEDHDRPLAARGRAAAPLIGAYLRRQRLPTSLVLCSSARRARETVELVDPAGEIEIEPELYRASADAMLKRLRQVPGTVHSVMLVGHNPAIHDLAVRLTGGDNAFAGRRFPTGALATLTFTGPWPALTFGSAELAAFVTPRQLS